VKECFSEAGLERIFWLCCTAKPPLHRNPVSVLRIHSCLYGTQPYSARSSGMNITLMLISF